MKTFQEFLSDDISDLKTLPLVHTTIGIDFLEIIKSKEINLFPCDVLKENLIFTYYGKAEYRPKESHNVNNATYPLVIFIFNTDVLLDIYGVYPFDTGAYVKIPEIKERFFHKKINVNDFKLANEIESAKKIIKTFFGSNENYINLETIYKKAFNRLDFQVDGYIKLLNDDTCNTYDNRVKTIEVSHHKKIKLDRNVLKQIILPTSFYEDEDAKRIINDDFGISNPLTYELSGGNNVEYWRLIDKLHKDNNLIGVLWVIG